MARLVRTNLTEHLYEVYAYSILPEFIEELGFEKTLRIIDIFGGKKIDIPSKDDLARVIRDARIFERLDGMGPVHFREEALEIAREEDLALSDVVWIFDKEKRMRGLDKDHPIVSREDIKKAIKETLDQMEKNLHFNPEVHVKYRRATTEKYEELEQQGYYEQFRTNGEK